MDLHTLRHPADRENARARMRRRSAPIRGYVGPNGSGKSLLAVYDLLPSLDNGRPVMSTVRLLDFRNPRPCDDPTCTWPGHPDHAAAHPLWIPFVSYQQLLTVRDMDILMDEVTGVASSREFASMPTQVANLLVQLRRRNLSLSWTTPNWARADKIIREVTQEVTVASPLISVTHKSKPGEPPVIWKDRLAIAARSYDPADLDDEDARQKGNHHVPAHNHQILWRPGLLVNNAYDTRDGVSSLGWANEAGMCIQCGGKRNVPKCDCTSHKIETATAQRVFVG